MSQIILTLQKALWWKKGASARCLCNVDPRLIDPCFLLWGVSWGVPGSGKGICHFWRERHPHIHKRASIHPGSTSMPRGAGNDALLLCCCFLEGISSYQKKDGVFCSHGQSGLMVPVKEGNMIAQEVPQVVESN